jgi:type IV secretory pathway VirB3-like protein
MSEPIVRPVFKALHEPLRVGAAGIRIDRGFVFLAMIAAMLSVVLLKSFVFAAVVIVMVLAAGVATRHDPQMLHILWRAQFVRARYDPLKHARFDVRIVDDDHEPA